MQIHDDDVQKQKYDDAQKQCVEKYDDAQKYEQKKEKKWGQRHDQKFEREYGLQAATA